MYKKILIFTIIFVLAILVIVKIAPIATAFKTVAVWINIFIPEGSWRPLDLSTSSPILEEYRIESESSRTLLGHLYLPGGKNKVPAIIIYTPFIGEGIENSHLVNIAKSFARGGFAVFLSSREEDQLVMSVKDIEDVISLFLFLQKHPRIDSTGIGLLGASYGAGPVIIAAANQRIKDQVYFVMSAAGYYDFENSLRFIVTGDFSYKEIMGHLEPWSYTREILQKTLEYHGLNGEVFETFISQPDLFEELIEKTPEIKELGRELSPSRVINNLKAEFFIFHSTDDVLIPYTESMRLADVLQNKVPVRFTLLSILEHGVPRPFTLKNIRRYYLPSLTDSYIFLYHLLNKYNANST